MAWCKATRSIIGGTSYLETFEGISRTKMVEIWCLKWHCKLFRSVFTKCLMFYCILCILTLVHILFLPLHKLAIKCCERKLGVSTGKDLTFLRQSYSYTSVCRNMEPLLFQQSYLLQYCIPSIKCARTLETVIINRLVRLFLFCMNLDDYILFFCTLKKIPEVKLS